MASEFCKHQHANKVSLHLNSDHIISNSLETVRAEWETRLWKEAPTASEAGALIEKLITSEVVILIYVLWQKQK